MAPILEKDIHDPNLFIYVFPEMRPAVQAQMALLAHENVTNAQLTSLADDNGVVEGSFLLEYKDGDEKSAPTAFQKMVGRNEGNHGLGKQPVIQHDVTLLLFRLDQGAAPSKDIRDLLSNLGGRPMNAL